MAGDIDAFWAWFRDNPGKWEKPRKDFDDQRFLVIYDRIGELFPDRSPEAGMGEAWVLEELGPLELADVKDAPKSAKPMSDLSAPQKRAARPRP